MRQSVAGTVTMLAVLAMAGCEAEAETEVPQDDTTQILLSGTSGISTEMNRGAAVDPNESMIRLAELGYDMGDDDAPIRIVEMSDYSCGFCRQFHAETFPILYEEFIETGKVVWKFIPFINGMFQHSLKATEGAECTMGQSQEMFATLNDRLWNEQASWKNDDDPAAVVRQMAGDAGVDLDEYDACLEDNRYIEKIGQSGGLARQLGVRGTPTFYVLGYPPIQGAMSTEAFQQVLRMIYEEQSATGAN